MFSPAQFPCKSERCVKEGRREGKREGRREGVKEGGTVRK